MAFHTDLTKTKRVSGFLGAAVAWLLMAPLAYAQGQQTVQFIPTPPDQGAPDGRQRGGATRGDCVAYQDLAAIVPEVEGVVWSQTAKALPTFFFDVPADLTQEIPLEFVIQDRSDAYVVRQQFSVEADAGLLAVPTTAELGGLAIGESYSWTFSIYCDAARPSASVSVNGTIQRVADAVEVETSTPDLTAIEQFELLRQYAAEGIWHETIDIAIALHQSDPLNDTYQETLRSLFVQAGIADEGL
ncbi:DUF928 domain-containing protein [cf. Phormidesmis sp. LEGE 11477]|uniref:DUF928 domain-containing protein n=1 Tax=cf. Phormidesmis sp. LEGE 11477 TaxID=1828680 RepID=UPI00187EFC2D|nr:DUF928 domain-containing protein [cf. Phormidesmis sp. LEGE 11477]MBE9063760.1 DUF928 domain-containing protein [cf. Phormidesmis sp. LEGE 11477]